MKIEKLGDGEFEKPQPISPMFAPALNERIKRVTDSAMQAELSMMIVEVEEKGKKLFSSKGRKEFEDYKAAVKKFMQKVLNSSFRIEEQHGKRRTGSSSFI